MFVLVLYSFICNNKQARTVFYEFTMGNMHEVLGSKTKLLGSGGEPSAPGGNIGGLGQSPQGLAIYVVF